MADALNPINRDELLKHLEGVRRLARSLVRDDAEADDVMQDAALAALESGRPVRKGVGAWLSGVTRNVVRNRRRGERRRAAREASVALPESTPSVSESVVRAAEQSRLLDHVVNLDEPYRTAIVLRYVDGLPPRVIATRLGLPVETVRTHVKRGLAQLRSELDRRHGGRGMWRATMLLVAGGAPYAPAGTAVGFKLVVGSACLIAFGLAAWWTWTLVQPDDPNSQPGLALANQEPPTPVPTGSAGPALLPNAPRNDVVGRGRADPVVEPPPGDVQEPEVPSPETGHLVESGRATRPPLEVREPVPVEPELVAGRPEAATRGRLIADQTGGRVSLPAARAWFGTPLQWVEGIASARRGNVPEAFALEAPRHQRDVGAFEIDLYEVTNAQYRRYLHLEAGRVFRVGAPIAGTLEQIARAVVVEHVPANIDWNQTARQLYRSNFGVLHDRHPQAIARAGSGAIDFARTWNRIRTIRIKTGTELCFYDRAPPPDWPSRDHAAGLAKHPVRGVSYEEAEAFAHWAGKHIPSEFEWEYACRGAQGRAYPWGGKPTGWEARVNGGASRGRGEEAHTRAFDTLPDGRSRIGIFHTLGNVSEWTSSFLEPYPDSAATHSLVGKAMVVRGGSAFDADALYVRPAFRGWRAAAPVAVGETAAVTDPLPDHRLAWTGFRCAVYPEPGRSRLPEMRRLLQSEGILPSSALGTRGYAAAESKELIAPGAPIESGIYVNQKAWSFVVAPLERLAVRDADKPPYFSLDAKHGVTDTPTLLSAAQSGTPILLGMIQSDTRIEGLHVVRGASTFKFPAKLYPTQAAPGIYHVGLVHGRLALLTPDLDSAYYLSPKPVTRAAVSVVRRNTPQRGDPRGHATQYLDTKAGQLTIDLEVPLGLGALSDRVVRVRFRYLAVADVVRNIEPWRAYPVR